MHEASVVRRGFLKALGMLGATRLGRTVAAEAAPTEIRMTDNIPAIRIELDAKALAGWTTVSGEWVVEDITGAPAGQKALVQRATKNAFNVIVAPAGPFTAVDVSVRFDPLSGKEDASGGIVFRFAADRYYVIRANALESNFRLYAYDRGRKQLASASVKAPALGQWHTIRVVALGDHIQGWLDGALLIDHRDSRFKTGRVGLWTKADSITAFSELTIRGVPEKGDAR
jgi:hypothetical protein